MGVGETITVINRSGKVVSSSKHIINVFKEAKSAYRERKAEIQAERNAAAQDRKLREGVKTIRLNDDDDTRSRADSHRSKHSKAGTSRSHSKAGTTRSKSRKSDHPLLERGFTDSFYANDDAASPRRAKHRFEDDLAGASQEGHRMELARRNTEAQVAVKRSDPARRKSDSGIDMDLCYGDIPPPLPEKRFDEVELREKASKITMLLDEANCLQYSVTSMIENLQKNPDALAAVALTLGEISTMVKKMGPNVLPILAKSFPAVVALLASPQFMIAGGVAVGVTIVALGGYKIVKRLQAQQQDQAQPMPMPMAMDAGGPVEEPLILDELEPPELSRIEVWRRGIADVEAESAGTSVDGEFITPGATRHLAAEGVLDEEDIKSRRSTRSKKDGEHRPKSHKAKSVRSEATTKTSKTSKTSKTAKSSSTTRSSKTNKDNKEKTKKKEPSGLKMLFRSHSS